MTLVVRSEIRFVEESFPECILALVGGFRQKEIPSCILHQELFGGKTKCRIGKHDINRRGSFGGRVAECKYYTGILRGKRVSHKRLFRK